MRKILIFIILAVLSIIVYFSYKPTKNIETPIKTITYPPEKYLDKLEEMEVQ